MDAELDPSTPGSVEAELIAADLGETITFTDLRPLPTQIPYIRGQSALSEAPIPTAFDALLSTLTATMDPTLPL